MMPVPRDLRVDSDQPIVSGYESAQLNVRNVAAINAGSWRDLAKDGRKAL